MSRGFGKSQVLILRALELRNAFYLAALADGNMTRYKSLHRAALKLETAGRISIGSYRAGAPKLFVTLLPVETHEVSHQGYGISNTFVEINRDTVKTNSAYIEQSLDSLIKDGSMYGETEIEA